MLAIPSAFGGDALAPDFGRASSRLTEERHTIIMQVTKGWRRCQVKRGSHNDGPACMTLPICFEVIKAEGLRCQQFMLKHVLGGTRPRTQTAHPLADLQRPKIWYLCIVRCPIKSGKPPGMSVAQPSTPAALSRFPTANTTPALPAFGKAPQWVLMESSLDHLVDRNAMMSRHLHTGESGRG